MVKLMKQIPYALNSKFKILLIKNKIPQRDKYFYMKWLRYYLDFCHKYSLNEYHWCPTLIEIAIYF